MGNTGNQIRDLQLRVVELETKLRRLILRSDKNLARLTLVERKHKDLFEDFHHDPDKDEYENR